VRWAPISDAFAVARFLSGIFCSLEGVESDEDYGDDDAQDALSREYHGRWLDVTKMLPGLGEVRDEEWGHGNDAAMQSLPTNSAAFQGFVAYVPSRSGTSSFMFLTKSFRLATRVVDAHLA
jgi:hypothetical protein